MIDQFFFTIIAILIFAVVVFISARMSMIAWSSLDTYGENIFKQKKPRAKGYWKYLLRLVSPIHFDLKHCQPKKSDKGLLVILSLINLFLLVFLLIIILTIIDVEKNPMMT